MSWRQELYQILLDQFQARKAKNPRYSVRAFSRKIGVASGPLSELLRGQTQWNLSVQRARRIVDNLDLPTGEKASLLIRMGLSPEAPSGGEVKEASLHPVSLRKIYSEDDYLAAKKADKDFPEELKDFRTLTFTGNTKMLKFLKSELDRLIEFAPYLLNDGMNPEETRTFCLSIQLHPVSPARPSTDESLTPPEDDQS
ncbi:MAG TPA: hypothetical protein PL182_04505 [Pseudobdellovibrionaceae bacterium]|nr:hypothetical protein [Pseudobdellovibrionaceae bacterium]